MKRKADTSTVHDVHTQPAPASPQSETAIRESCAESSVHPAAQSQPLTLDQQARIALLKQRQADNRKARKFKSAKQKPETGLMKRIQTTLKLYPWARLERNNRGRFKGRLYGLDTPGSSDLVGGVTMAESGFERTTVLEVKMPNEKPTQEQLEYIDDVNRRGGYGRVVRSTDEAVIAILESRDGVRL